MKETKKKKYPKEPKPIKKVEDPKIHQEEFEEEIDRALMKYVKN
jgi:hypothetical protein